MSLGITVGQQDGKTYVFGGVLRFLSRVQQRTCYRKLYIIVYYTLIICIMLHHNITVSPFDQYANRDLALLIDHRSITHLFDGYLSRITSPRKYREAQRKVHQQLGGPHVDCTRPSAPRHQSTGFWRKQRLRLRVVSDYMMYTCRIYDIL